MNFIKKTVIRVYLYRSRVEAILRRILNRMPRIKKILKNIIYSSNRKLSYNETVYDRKLSEREVRILAQFQNAVKNQNAVKKQ